MIAGEHDVTVTVFLDGQQHHVGHSQKRGGKRCTMTLTRQGTMRSRTVLDDCGVSHDMYRDDVDCPRRRPREGGLSCGSDGGGWMEAGGGGSVMGGCTGRDVCDAIVTGWGMM